VTMTFGKRLASASAIGLGEIGIRLVDEERSAAQLLRKRFQSEIGQPWFPSASSDWPRMSMPLPVFGSGEGAANPE